MKTRRGSEIIHRGCYTIRQHQRGGMTVYGPKIRNRGQYVPPDVYLKTQYEELTRSDGHPSLTWSSFITHVSFRGVAETGRRSTPDGFRALSLPYNDRLIRLEEIKEAIRAFWPEKEVRDYYNHEPDARPPKMLLDFIRKHEGIYHSAERTHRGFHSIFDLVFSPARYPNLNHLIRRKPKFAEDGKLKLSSHPEVCQVRDVAKSRLPKNVAAKVQCVNLDHIVRELVYRNNHGISIESQALRFSTDRMDKLIYAVVGTIVKAKTKRRDKSGRVFYQVIEDLTGIKQEDICVTSEARKDYARIAEMFTELVFTLAAVKGYQLSPLPLFHRLPTKKERIFYYNGSEGRTDLRLSDNDLQLAIETKTGRNITARATLEDALEKYARHSPSWRTGEKITTSVLVFHKDQQSCDTAKQHLGRIKSEWKESHDGLVIFDYQLFHTHLKNLIDTLKPKERHEIAQLSPRVHAPENLLSLHQELSENPQALLRASNNFRRKYSLESLLALISYFGGEVEDEF